MTPTIAQRVCRWDSCDLIILRSLFSVLCADSSLVWSPALSRSPLSSSVTPTGRPENCLKALQTHLKARHTSKCNHTLFIPEGDVRVNEREKKNTLQLNLCAFLSCLRGCKTLYSIKAYKRLSYRQAMRIGHIIVNVSKLCDVRKIQKVYISVIIYMIKQKAILPDWFKRSIRWQVTKLKWKYCPLSSTVGVKYM